MSLDPWLPGFTIGIIVLLIVVFSAFLLFPPRHKDPQYGMAIGCYWITMICLGTLLAIYLVARYFQVVWLSRGIEGACLFVVVLVLGNLIVGGTRHLFRRIRDRREQ